jgi:coproporphyrinogen III oxidase
MTISQKCAALKMEASRHFKVIQAQLCEKFETFEPSERFLIEEWERPKEDGVSYGGGGISRVLKNGEVFEQAGVNFSQVEGILNKEMSLKLNGSETELPFFATGVSLVIHPKSPHIPTTHANGRFLQVGEKFWCGGGADLTPYILDEEDATHFHLEMKRWCDRHSEDYYPEFKKWCDKYFYNHHRKEGRGIGGIFYDYLGQNDPERIESYWNFTQEIGQAFAAAYFPLVEKNQLRSYSESQRNFQLLRRGRYVEFNLLHDRGTKFGLETGGRIESILMSLPPLVRWDESYRPPQDSEESRLIEVLKNPRDWT